MKNIFLTALLVTTSITATLASPSFRFSAKLVSVLSPRIASKKIKMIKYGEVGKSFNFYDFQIGKDHHLKLTGNLTSEGINANAFSIESNSLSDDAIVDIATRLSSELNQSIGHQAYVVDLAQNEQQRIKATIHFDVGIDPHLNYDLSEDAFNVFFSTLDGIINDLVASKDSLAIIDRIKKEHSYPLH